MTARWIESVGFIKVSIYTRHIQIIRTTGGRFVRSTCRPTTGSEDQSERSYGFHNVVLSSCNFPDLLGLDRYSVLSTQRSALRTVFHQSPRNTVSSSCPKFTANTIQGYGRALWLQCGTKSAARIWLWKEEWWTQEIPIRRVEGRSTSTKPSTWLRKCWGNRRLLVGCSYAEGISCRCPC